MTDNLTPAKKENRLRALASLPDLQGKMPAIPPEALPVPTSKSPVYLDDLAKARFLDDYVKYGSITHAARAAGVSRKTIYNHLNKDEDFAEMKEDCYRLYVDLPIIEARRRAMEGVDEPLSYQGELTGEHINRKSDRLLEKVLEAQAPGFSKKVDVSHNHTGGVLIVQADVKSLDDWKKKFARGTQQVIDAGGVDVVEGVCEGDSDEGEDADTGASL